MKRVLLCGHRCFAAKGLVDLLESSGYQVTLFSRGPVHQVENVITGPVHAIASNPFLTGPFECVVNYVLLHGQSISENESYIRALLDLCTRCDAKHLIHISSCSVYANEASIVTEDAPIEAGLSNKGPYAAIKIAQEATIQAHRPKSLKVTLVRPGLILSNGMGGYMGGIGIRLPWNTIIGLGSAKSQLPLVIREQVNEAILEIIMTHPSGDCETFLLADAKSTTRREYLELCMRYLGAGMRLRFFPVFVWLSAAHVAEFIFRVLGKKEIGILSKVRSVCRFQTFQPSKTESRLGVSLSKDWGKEIITAFDGQKKNFAPLSVQSIIQVSERPVAIIGFGRIVKQRHLPALRYLGISEGVKAFDLASGLDSETGISVNSLDKLDEFYQGPQSISILASPGPVHIDALEKLSKANGPIIVEKPLCYSREEFLRWDEFAKNHMSPVIACHNYRFKSNLLKVRDIIARFNPGELHHVSVVFQSPAVNKEAVPWLKAERKARTLLMDYGIHPLDIACMFSVGAAKLEECRFELNKQKETCLIQGCANFANHSLTFLLRQGLMERKCRIDFTFQNYTITVGLAPDIVVCRMADENFGLSMLESLQCIKATGLKVFDKLSGRNSDLSHAHVFSQACSSDRNQELYLPNLSRFYNLLFQIADSVYND